LKNCNASDLDAVVIVVAALAQNFGAMPPLLNGALWDRRR
jgi:hypothetical protein